MGGGCPLKTARSKTIAEELKGKRVVDVCYLDRWLTLCLENGTEIMIEAVRHDENKGACGPILALRKTKNGQSEPDEDD